MNEEKLVISNKTYDRAKWATMILLPAFSALYFGLGNIWGFPNTEEVVGSVAVLTTFLGAILGISTKAYNQTSSMDGFLVKTGSDEDTGMPNLSMTLTKTPDELLDQDSVRLKVTDDT